MFEVSIHFNNQSHKRRLLESSGTKLPCTDDTARVFCFMAKGGSMNRREFLYGAAATTMGIAHGEAQGESIMIELSSSHADWPTVPIDFVGLSYESGQLYNADYFALGNAALIKAFRELTPKGVLRLGGHLSNVTPWEGAGRNEPKQVRGVRHGIEDYWEWPLVDPSVQKNKRGMITRAALRNLRGFLDAVDWRLMYGLNFASGSAARAADEAAAVHEILGNRLIAFVIGNEPDGFGEDPFFRDKDYAVTQYMAEWEAWVKTIRASVPDAQFAGPDTDGQVNTWVLEFARRTRGEAMMLTSHYYGMGPASAPGMTAERLLAKATPKLDAEIAAVQAARAAAGGTPYRMDEGNSCFGGGKAGVSDAYASTLWAADYMLRAACAGFAGVNLHGGGSGIYTPVESSAENAVKARPVYYGMQLAQRFVGSRVVPCLLKTAANITAYQGIKQECTMLAVVNKGASAVEVSLPRPLHGAKRWEISGPALDAKTGVTFQPIRPASSTVTVRAYSAILLESA
jgi:hypothetical protein